MSSHHQPARQLNVWLPNPDRWQPGPGQPAYPDHQTKELWPSNQRTLAIKPKNSGHQTKEF
jgi:hypothetical protein